MDYRQDGVSTRKAFKNSLELMTYLKLGASYHRTCKLAFVGLYSYFPHRKPGLDYAFNNTIVLQLLINQSGWTDISWKQPALL